MRKKSTVYFIVILFLTFSCKSVQFKEKRNEANEEVSEIFRDIKDATEKELSLTYNFIKIASVLNYTNNEFLTDLNNNRIEVSELNLSFNEKRLSKKNIQKFFSKKYELTEQLNRFIPELVISNKENQNLIALINTFQKNENLLKKIINEYNSIIEQNSKFVNYPKYKPEE